MGVNDDGFIPDVVHDTKHLKEYSKGRFMGKGGFARCYELTERPTGAVYAGKIVSKLMLKKAQQYEKMMQEIEIHRRMNHFHIVRFYSHFEDTHNVYIILEICQRRTLMELQKRRNIVTEPESRYFMSQIADAVRYLHDHGIIHRDLKLGNLFLNQEMHVKIGDFGLAAVLQNIDERKKTLCGTPNYIAPEVLSKGGHGKEVDVWALGCILFTLLVGKPPFETHSLRETYSRIKNNSYFIPPGSMSQPTSSIVKLLLHADPTKRPTVGQFINSSFLVDGFKPERLPISCCTTAPRFDEDRYLANKKRKPLTENNTEIKKAKRVSVKDGTKENVNPFDLVLADSVDPFLISKLEKLIKVVVEYHNCPVLSDDIANPEDFEDPTAMPFLWVSRWVDYSDKYGLGYELCDDSVGIVFNDNTRLIQPCKKDNIIQYINENGDEMFYKIGDHPIDLVKKITLLKCFCGYMSENLMKAGGEVTSRRGDTVARLPYIRAWFRTRNAMVLQLSNGTLQINFFRDHTKLILCPVMEAVTLIEDHKFHTYKFDKLSQHGVSRSLYSHLRYAHVMVCRILEANATGRLRSTA